MDNTKLREVTTALRAIFSDVPETFSHNGQTFEERCEAWARHAIEQLEEELCRRFRNFYRCPRCGHEWQDEWDSMCDDQCPACHLKSISPYRSEDL
jgi:rubrerythrin